MLIQVNGDLRELSDGTTVAALLDRMELRHRRVAVEVNGEIVPRSRHRDWRLEDGDRVELVQAMGGG
ncbi:MAG TPA: sulfur carrier protein ThiS [Xanthomonadaceae bacterium]|nr:sulfur carrier protein ThiS [Xanthomonadaceae bacterium]